MLVRVRSSKKAAIYDGCNRNSISRSCSRDAPQRRQPSTTAATLGQALDQARHSLLKEGSHLRRLQHSERDGATTGRPLLKEGSHLRRLQRD